jgi:hypothetical protein
MALIDTNNLPAEATTAFRDQHRLFTNGRVYVQGLIDMMIGSKKKG